MISVQINVNTTLIAHVYIRNVYINTYKWSYYMPDYGMVTGEVKHIKEQGIEELLALVFKKVNESVKKNLKKRV